MRYGIQRGSGSHTHNGVPVTVVSFGSSSALRAWVNERPHAREEICAKKYVQTSTGRNVSVRNVAISPDELRMQTNADHEVLPLEMEREQSGDYKTS